MPLDKSWFWIKIIRVRSHDGKDGENAGVSFAIPIVHHIIWREVDFVKNYGNWCMKLTFQETQTICDKAHTLKVNAQAMAKKDYYSPLM